MNFSKLYKFKHGVHKDIPFYYDDNNTRLRYSDVFFATDLPGYCVGEDLSLALNYEYCLYLTVNKGRGCYLPLIKIKDDVVVYFLAERSFDSLFFYFAYDNINRKQYELILTSFKLLIRRRLPPLEFLDHMSVRTLISVMPYAKNILDYFKIKKNFIPDSCCLSFIAMKDLNKAVIEFHE